MDRDAANNLFHGALWPHASTVLRMALFLTNHHQSEAEDIAQETMLKAFRSLDRFTPGTDAKGWLLTILRNTWVDRVRSRNARKDGASLSDIPQEPVAPESDAAESEWTDADDVLSRFADQEIIAALHGLPEEIRWTLLLVDVQGLDQSEAAQIMSVPEGTVKSRAHRGRRMLRDLLLPRARDLGFLGRAQNRPDQTEAKP